MDLSKILTRATLAKAAILVCCSLLSYLIGAVIGFEKGATAGITEHAVGETVHSVTALQALRNDEADKAISLLNVNLNAEIATWKLYENSWHSIFNVSRWTVIGDLREQNVELSTALVAEYLKNHPSEYTDIQEFIEARAQDDVHFLPESQEQRQ